MVNISNPIEQRFATLNINDNVKATPPRSSYIPPHLRSRGENGNPRGGRVSHNSPNRNTRWNESPSSNRLDSPGYSNRYSDNSRGWGRNREIRNSSYDANANRRGHDSHGSWSMGKHIPGTKNPALEKELFGLAEDKDRLSSGINFEKYEDIPVEATGNDVPEPINTFEDSNLEALLLSNIELARYTTPTPVQKHSITIVEAGRDLMACAQTGSGKTGGFLFPILSECFKVGPVANAPEQPQMGRS
ncbi:ATP-dependent RNA helicase ded1, partial [Basidiobolus ranarum]